MEGPDGVEMQQLVAKVERDTTGELGPLTQSIEGIDACLAAAPDGEVDPI